MSATWVVITDVQNLDDLGEAIVSELRHLPREVVVLGDGIESAAGYNGNSVVIDGIGKLRGHTRCLAHHDQACWLPLLPMKPKSLGVSPHV